jgi:hypothetical protein
MDQEQTNRNKGFLDIAFFGLILSDYLEFRI